MMQSLEKKQAVKCWFCGDKIRDANIEDNHCDKCKRSFCEDCSGLHACDCMSIEA